MFIIFLIALLICGFNFNGYVINDIKIKSIKNGTKYDEELEKSILFRRSNLFIVIAFLLIELVIIYTGDIISFIIFLVLFGGSIYKRVKFYIESKKATG